MGIGRLVYADLSHRLQIWRDFEHASGGIDHFLQGHALCQFGEHESAIFNDFEHSLQSNRSLMQIGDRDI